MAFNVQYLNLCSYSVNEVAPAFYSYVSTEDSLSTILNPYYFSSIASELGVNDLLYITDNTFTQSGKGFYFIIDIDLPNKIVSLAPMINQSGAISAWNSVDSSTVISSTTTKLVANQGYKITASTNTKNQLNFVLPAVASVNVGDTIMFTNLVGAHVVIKQNASQQIYFPISPPAVNTTTEGVAGFISSGNVGDSFTLVCIYNNTINPNGSNPPPDKDLVYGTDFNISNLSAGIGINQNVW